MSQSFTQNFQHTIFSTRDRCKWIDRYWADHLYSYIGGIIRGISCKLLIAGGTVDHIHLLSSIDKNLTIPNFVRSVKSSSTTWTRKKFKDRKTFAWQNGYASFSVSESQIDRVQKYIINQETHHRNMDYKSELKKFLYLHQVEFDERYLWK